MNSPRLVLHIGMHKTGSTAFQHVMKRYRHLWGCLGVEYHAPKGPDGRHFPKAVDVFEALAHENDHGHPHPDWGASQGLVSALRLPGPKVRVVSAEGLSGVSSAFATGFASLASADLTVIAVLRPPADWAQSFYTQMIHNQNTREARSFADFIADPTLQAHLDQLTLLDRWAGAIAPGRVIGLRYQSGVDMVPVILRAAGLPRWPARLPRAPRRQNHRADLALTKAAWRENGGQGAYAIDAHSLRAISDRYDPLHEAALRRYSTANP